MLPLPQGSVSRLTSTLVYARSVYKHLNIVLLFWKIFVVISEKDDLAYMILLDIHLINERITSRDQVLLLFNKTNLETKPFGIRNFKST